MNITHFHRKSPLKSEAEDSYALVPAAGVYAVLDGVTPLHEYRNHEGHNGAFIAANLLKTCFEEWASLKQLDQIIVDANQLLREQMIAEGADLSILHQLWATCVAAIQVRGPYIHYAQLGDSMIVAVYRDGRVVALTENRVIGVSERAVLYRGRARNAGESLEDESYYEIPQHKHAFNRWLANHPDGYGVVNGMLDIRIHMQSGTIPLADVDRILLLTDGLFHPELTLEEGCLRMMELGFEAYADEVVLKEQERNAAPDDRTGIWITFD